MKLNPSPANKPNEDPKAALKAAAHAFNANSK
jgi:hypothetical protein